MKTNINSLIAKHLSGTIDEAGKKEIEKWQSASEENAKLIDHYHKIWDKAKEIKPVNNQQVEDALLLTKKQIFTSKPTKRYLVYFRQAVAVLVIAIGLMAIFKSFNREAQNVTSPIYKEVVAGYGMNTNLTLPDGTNVNLFPGSKLLFPISFAEELREVRLEGEGYFKVTHNEKVPFIVKTNQINIKVLGTEFNVSAYEGDKYVETILVNGKVAIEKEIDGESIELKVLKPNQRSRYDLLSGKLIVTEETDLDKFVAWHKEQLIFDGETWLNVTKRLERWYNVNIILDKQLENQKITGVFKGEPIEEVLQLMQFTSPIEYKIERESRTAGDAPGQKKIIINQIN
ncbi:MAG: DUF4974 domain-containing protein [Carboxylicivirga sp.]|jgi:ferric-dicitrate binding protein FerR (iron transport regulator)|nr:DUF4974 domain-containing protein [Carboxylicivirga sp.]